jgi:hypothetical protein
LNDSLIIIGNIIGIFIGFLFIFTIYRLDHPDYSTSNLIVCNACFSIGLISIIMLTNACYALKSDFRGIGYFDSWCILRGILLKAFHIYMYISLCLKAFNRLCCIVYYTNPILKSYRCLVIIILFQWLITILLVLIIFLTDGVDYDWGSHLCIVSVRKTYQFMFMSKNFNKIKRLNLLFLLFLVGIYYISILFISGVYIYVLYYVLHLPLLERYRRKRQLAVLRRILVLLIMLIIPGCFSTFMAIRWFFYGTVPLYSFKIRTLLDTIGHTGSVLTIFISHTKIRRQYYLRKPIRKKKIIKKIQLENCELIVFSNQRHSRNKTFYV